VKLIALHGKYGEGKFAIVDDDLFERLNQWRWHYHYHKSRRDNHCYACRGVKISKNKTKTIAMHQEIMNTPKGMKTDHKNNNNLDNRKYNLRICTDQQNQMNSLPSRGGTSKHKGVHWSKKYNRWIARVGINRKKVFLGHFTSEVKAAKAYNRKAKELFGEYACLNSI